MSYAEETLAYINGILDALNSLIKRWEWDTIGDLSARMNFGEVLPLAELFAAASRYDKALALLEGWAEGEEEYDPDSEDWADEAATIAEFRKLTEERSEPI